MDAADAEMSDRNEGRRHHPRIGSPPLAETATEDRSGEKHG